MSLMSLSKTSLVLAGLLAVAGPAAAQQTVASSYSTIVESVPVNDLDLNTDAGLATLHHRIWIAAHRVCEPAVGPALDESYSACLADAVHSARTSVQAVLAANRTAGRFAMNGPAH